MVRGDARTIGDRRSAALRPRSASPGVGLGRGRAPLRGSSLAALLGAALLLPAAASAHELGLSQGIYRVVRGDGPTGEGASVSVTLTLARAELRLLAHDVDQDRDGEVSEAEMMVGAGAIEEAIVGGLHLSVDERPCAARFDGATLTEEDGLEIALRFRCPGTEGPDRSDGSDGSDGSTSRTSQASPPGAPKADPGASPDADPGPPGAELHRLEIDFPALIPLGGRHRHIARVIPPGADQVRAERVLHRLRSRAKIPLAPPSPTQDPATPAGGEDRRERSTDESARGAPTDRPAPPGDLAQTAAANTSQPPVDEPTPIDRELGAYFFLGIEHILTGVDHLVFLLGLLIAGGRLRAWALMITAFTVGHSLSLALATLAIWTPPPAIIEPLIAASVAYIGLENLLRSDTATARRWRLTLPFGFIHGFGFAGALSEIGVRAGDTALASVLALFNIGVEVGQLAALAVILLLLRALPPLQSPSAKRSISAAIALAGLAWLIARLL